MPAYSEDIIHYETYCEIQCGACGQHIEGQAEDYSIEDLADSYGFEQYKDDWYCHDCFEAANEDSRDNHEGV